MAAKEQIIALFRANVKGKRPDTTGRNQRHDGRTGHWLEQQFGIAANGDNSSDLMGYELKNETTSKTTFGDWSANEYIFNNPDFRDVFVGNSSVSRRDRFLGIFGKPNPLKGGRLSWSGQPCPTIRCYNAFGQKLLITEDKDIIAVYSYRADRRPDKAEIVPTRLQQENLELARWYGASTPAGKHGKCLKKKLEDKFNDKGWFTCKTGGSGRYCKICFGKPMTYDEWIKLVEEGIVFFDSGMYQGNARPYSQWRANNNYWDSLIEETFE